MGVVNIHVFGHLKSGLRKGYSRVGDLQSSRDEVILFCHLRKTNFCV